MNILMDNRQTLEINKTRINSSFAAPITQHPVKCSSVI